MIGTRCWRTTWGHTSRYNGIALTKEELRTVCLSLVAGYCGQMAASGTFDVDEFIKEVMGDE